MSKNSLLDKDGVAIVRSREDFQSIWRYSIDQLKEEYYPKSFPCLVEIIRHSGGLGGGYTEHHIVDIPENMDPSVFLAGYKQGRAVRDY